MPQLSFVDSHTGGEPTRTIIAGGPDLPADSQIARHEALRREHDWLRRTVILEPRGCDWLVGALLTPPLDPTNAAGVIFFNNVGYLGMCGHGLIGVVETLKWLGRIETGQHGMETPVGLVRVQLHEDGAVSLDNVASYVYQTDVAVPLGEAADDDDQVVRGDIAYGGNWFFLAQQDDVRPERLPELLTRSRAIRAALDANEIRGVDGAVIDHIELYGEPSDASVADSRNFVLCPGGQYDRSPCGTGTSAKIACLAAAGKLQEGEVWRQQSITGSLFTATYRAVDAVQGRPAVQPTIRGRAYVTSEGQLNVDPDDPFAHGIQLAQGGGRE